MSRHLLTFAVTLSLAALLAPPARAAPAQERPYSCRLLDDAQHKCASGQCDNREIERLRKECLRDGGRPPSNRGLKDELSRFDIELDRILMAHLAQREPPRLRIMRPTR